MICIYTYILIDTDIWFRIVDRGKGLAGSLGRGAGCLYRHPIMRESQKKMAARLDVGWGGDY